MAGNWLFNFFCFVDIFFILDWEVEKVLRIEIGVWHIQNCFCHPPFADTLLKSSEVDKPTLVFIGVCKYVKIPAHGLDLLHLLAQYFLLSLV